ncbi:DsrE family protein [Sulfidibacter corallicola]|uniref:DsrE family protein n=1 Tax=Sulfidibacter corallicola TaxID=2818388 RepID=A0A8A4TTA9_SULCO|nr:DsrE family protein [Sulfidibacter corallicola]QTD52282.1 DsrE family protein [Sulfidibacter corallicola]
MSKTLTLALMDAPYEKAASTTALRLIHEALSRGHNVNVFAYEGAVNLTMADQKPHANPVKGTSLEEEDHPTTKEWIGSLFELAENKGATLKWINCGLCVDERGAGNWIPGPVRGGPPHFVAFAKSSDATLVIPTK